MLSTLKSHGVDFQPHNGRLAVRGLQNLTLEEAEKARAWIRTHKDEILKTLGETVKSLAKGERLRDLQNMPGHCSCCGGTDFWRNNAGDKICLNCHPPARPEVFVILSEGGHA